MSRRAGGSSLRALSIGLLLVAPVAAQPTFIGVWGEPGNGLGEFVAPSGLAVNGGDTLYVADAFLDRVTLFNSNGVPLRTFGSTGSLPGGLRNPLGLAIDAGGDVYVADSGNQRIQRFHADGTFVEAVGDSGSGPGQLLVPSGILLTPQRQLYVVDHGNRSVQRYDWSISPPTFVGDVGGGALSLQGPTDVAVDAEGLLYVTDLLSHEIVRLRPDGQVVRRFQGAGSPDEPPSPLGVLVDGAALHVTDVLNGQVETFDLQGNRLYAWPVGGIPGPSRLARDSSRRLFVSSGQARVIFLYQLPLAVQGSTWSRMKETFRRAP